jgi:hypothetical protein
MSQENVEVPRRANAAFNSGDTNGFAKSAPQQAAAGYGVSK